MNDFAKDTAHEPATPDVAELVAIRRSAIGFTIASPPGGPVHYSLNEDGWHGVMRSEIAGSASTAITIEEAILGLADAAIERFPNSTYAWSRLGGRNEKAEAPLAGQDKLRSLSAQADGGLSELELYLLDLSTELANGLSRMIRRAPVDDGITTPDKDSADNDWDEVAIHVHTIQAAIMSQAAARDHPDILRLKGSGFKKNLAERDAAEAEEAIDTPKVEGCCCCREAKPAVCNIYNPASTSKELVHLKLLQEQQLAPDEGYVFNGSFMPEDPLFDGIIKSVESHEKRIARLEGVNLTPPPRGASKFEESLRKIEIEEAYRQEFEAPGEDDLMPEGLLGSSVGKVKPTPRYTGADAIWLYPPPDMPTLGKDGDGR